MVNMEAQEHYLSMETYIVGGSAIKIGFFFYCFHRVMKNISILFWLEKAPGAMKFCIQAIMSFEYSQTCLKQPPMGSLKCGC